MINTGPVDSRSPCSMRRSSLLARLPERPTEPAPVLLLQANFIERGLLLVFNAQHNCTDMTGQVQAIKLLAQAMRDEAFTAEQRRIGNMPRLTVIPALDRLEQVMGRY